MTVETVQGHSDNTDNSSDQVSMHTSLNPLPDDKFQTLSS